MAETVKFTEDEMKSLSELQNTYQQLTTRMGQVEIQRLVQEQGLDAIAQEKEGLENQWVENQKKERELVDELNKKYGPGTLDPQSGEFTPTPQEPAQEVSE